MKIINSYLYYILVSMLINHWRQVQNGIQNFASTSVAAPPIFHSINACMYCLVVGVSASEYHIFTLKFLFIKLCKTLNRKNPVLVGNYPFHWHMCGDVTNSYIRGSSIRDSNARCVTVHATNGAVVS